MWATALATILFWPLCHCSSAISLGWNTSYSFGPDGPWNAISVGIQNPNTSQQETVSLIPANRFVYSWIPSPVACSKDTSTSCGSGGTLAWPDVNNPAGFTRNRTAGNWSYVLSGNVETLSMSFGNQVVPSANVVAFNSSNTTYPSGQERGAEFGVFYLGGQTIGGNPNNTLCANFTCDSTLWLFNNGMIPSYTHGLTLGSAALGFPGSLVMGGYDSGRVIGPVLISQQQATTLSYFTQPLLDVQIGVETGGNPLPSDAVTQGLLRLGEQHVAQPLLMTVDSQTPYIFLPSATIQALITDAQLPVYLDMKSKYYLWDTTNPLYPKVVTSATYLAFIFSVTASDAGITVSNITIKVPFMLLNLTLEPSASGLDSNVAYFPIQPDDASGTTNPYVFGRAFLQAAFWGKNWHQNASWLAQAPGPGANRQGLGYLPQDIQATQTLLSPPSATNLFNDSWAGYWTPLPIDESSDAGKGQKGLSTGAIAGIAVAIVLVALIALIALVFYCLIRRKRTKSQAEALAQAQAGEKDQAPPQDQDHRSMSVSKSPVVSEGLVFHATPYDPYQTWTPGTHPVEQQQPAYFHGYSTAPQYSPHELGPNAMPSELPTHTYPKELPSN